jgi:hypothetical protein
VRVRASSASCRNSTPVTRDRAFRPDRTRTITADLLLGDIGFAQLSHKDVGWPSLRLIEFRAPIRSSCQARCSYSSVLVRCMHGAHQPSRDLRRLLRRRCRGAWVLLGERWPQLPWDRPDDHIRAAVSEQASAQSSLAVGMHQVTPPAPSTNSGRMTVSGRPG